MTARRARAWMSWSSGKDSAFAIQSGWSGHTDCRFGQGAGMDGDVVTVERVIPARAEAIFDLVADAGKHPVIDRSGTVKEAKPGAPRRLTLESKFGMSMKVGIAYS